MYTAEEFDKDKTKIMKFVVYKKRTENEIRMKFSSLIEENILEDIIEYLKEAGYINDYDYIEKAIREYENLKNMSIKEVKYKLYAKGLSSKIVENYIQDNRERLEEYEKKSAENIMNKKAFSMEETEVIMYLLKKGYREENIKRNEK